MSDSFLSRELLKRITGKVRGTAQVRQLQRQGIRFLVNSEGEPIYDGDGFPLVPREGVIGLSDVAMAQREPDFSPLRRKAYEPRLDRHGKKRY